MVDIKKLDNFFSILNKDSKKISKIKYVALGDSFVAGHNSKIGFNTNGNLTKGEISGLGYPSFLASLLQKNSELSLEAYDNLALPLSNIDLWIALLTLDKKAIVEAQNIIDFIQTHSKTFLLIILIIEILRKMISKLFMIKFVKQILLLCLLA